MGTEQILEELKQLTTFYAATSTSVFEEGIEKVVHYIMRNLGIRAGETNYLITECEMYLYTEPYHKDVYTHRSEQQLLFCKWYFNGFGLDFTLGNGQVQAGLLIRGIKNCGTGDFTSGPSNVLQELFSSLGSAIQPVGTFKIVSVQNSVDTKIISAKRVGLKPHHDDGGGFIDKPYRFISHLTKKHEFSNKYQVIKALMMEGKNENIDKNALGYRIKTK